jgi:hypothetical protein
MRRTISSNTRRSPDANIVKAPIIVVKDQPSFHARDPPSSRHRNFCAAGRACPVARPRATGRALLPALAGSPGRKRPGPAGDNPFCNRSAAVKRSGRASAFDPRSRRPCRPTATTAHAPFATSASALKTIGARSVSSLSIQLLSRPCWIIAGVAPVAGQSRPAWKEIRRRPALWRDPAARHLRKQSPS